MQKWEYLMVSFRQAKNGVPHLFSENGQQVRDLEHSPVMYEYTRQLGEQGWELASAPADFLWIFKRPKQ